MTTNTLICHLYYDIIKVVKNMIIVYGGTFNPPTLAHEQIVKEVINKFNPVEFIILPVGDDYTWKKGFASFNDRVKMLKLAFKNSDVFISELENKPNFKGTYDSLNQIRKAKNKDIYFLLGSDNLFYLDKWINYEKLLNDYKFIVLTRDGFDAKELIQKKYKTYQNHFEIMEVDIDISATKFRENKDYSKDINTDVLKYIQQHHLYEVGKDEA